VWLDFVGRLRGGVAVAVGDAVGLSGREVDVLEWASL